MMEIRFSDSDDQEDEAQMDVPLVSTTNTIETLFSKNKLQSSNNNQEIEKIGGLEIHSQSQSAFSNTLCTKSQIRNGDVQNTYVLKETEKKLMLCKGQQKSLDKEINAVKTNDDFMRIRQTYLKIQTALNEVNKILSKENKGIKDMRESQLSEPSQPSQMKDKRLVRKAKELIVQQKLLIKLLKLHKEIGRRLTNMKVVKLDKNSNDKEKMAGHTQRENKQVPPQSEKQKTAKESTHVSHTEDIQPKKPLNINHEKNKTVPVNHLSIKAKKTAGYQLDATQNTTIMDSDRRNGTVKPKICEAEKINLWKKEEFGSSHEHFPGEFWEVGLQSVEFYASLMAGEEEIVR